MYRSKKDDGLPDCCAFRTLSPHGGDGGDGDATDDEHLEFENFKCWRACTDAASPPLRAAWAGVIIESSCKSIFPSLFHKK